MPELPEVETMCRGLNKILNLGKNKERIIIEGMEFKRGNIRSKIPQKQLRSIIGQKLLPIRRRAKYLIFPTEMGSLLNHLGMTGYWREYNGEPLLKHDHFLINFSNGKALVFNDARRFGVIDYLSPQSEASNIWLKHLGVEPLSTDFNAEYLFNKLKKRSGFLKNIIMDQKLVVGVGNIYASEALFLAKVHPKKNANKLNLKMCQSLVISIKEILKKALASGGSTIRDFRQAGGELGYFARELKVYGRSGQVCTACASTIKSEILGGRSTFWCPKCQKK